VRGGGLARALAAAALLAVCAGGLTGCSNTKDLWARIWGSSTPGPGDGAIEADADLALRAQEELDASDYAEAAELFQQLKDQYPQSRYAVLAELRLGDAYFLNGKYIEAYGAYDAFSDRHPTNDAVPYALYQKGMCWFQRMNGIDRDQSPTIQAINDFAYLVEVYPDSRYSTMAHARIAESMNSLAGHEFYIGEYYFNRKDYAAAMRRFRGLIRAYPDSGYHPRAFNYIARYEDMVASGEIQPDTNLRGAEYESPFTISDETSGAAGVRF
jgi:outer membrane protein assembly factor BamD